MRKTISVSLPVINIDASKNFHEAIGFAENAQFSDEASSCTAWSVAMVLMLLTHDRWRGFTGRPVPPSTSSEVVLALSCDSRGAVDAMNAAALEHQSGGLNRVGFACEPRCVPDGGRPA